MPQHCCDFSLLKQSVVLPYSRLELAGGLLVDFFQSSGSSRGSCHDFSVRLAACHPISHNIRLHSIGIGSNRTACTIWPIISSQEMPPRSGRSSKRQEPETSLTWTCLRYHWHRTCIARMAQSLILVVRPGRDSTEPSSAPKAAPAPLPILLLLCHLFPPLISNCYQCTCS